MRRRGPTIDWADEDALLDEQDKLAAEVPDYRDTLFPPGEVIHAPFRSADHKNMNDKDTWLATFDVYGTDRQVARDRSGPGGGDHLIVDQGVRRLGELLRGNKMDFLGNFLPWRSE